MPRALKLAFAAAATVVLPLAGSTGCASGHHMSRSEALGQAGLYIEGPSTIPPEVSARVLADSGALQLYDDLLNGRQRWEPGADSAMMLRWLALSEQPRFLPTFLHYANPNLPVGRGHDVFSYASVGLARLVTLPAARQRLIELGQPSTPAVYRAQLVRILAFRNTDGTREVLRSIYIDDLPAALRERAAAADSLR